MQHGWVELPLEALGYRLERDLHGGGPARRRALHVARRLELRPARPDDRIGAHLRRPLDESDESLAPMDPLWYKDAIIYEVHVRAFSDSNGDGIGDFAGLTQQAALPAGSRRHLPLAAAVLSVAAHATTATTSPTTRASTRSTGRSTTSSGSSTRRTPASIRVLTELVINHTSDQHPWFQRARRAPKGSPERDFYVWSDTDTKYARHAHHLHRHREVELDVGPGRRPVLLAPLLLAPARPELRQSGGARGDARRDALLARPGRRRAAARRHPVPHRARGHDQREPAGDARHPASRSAASSTPTTRVACCSPRPTSGRPTSAPTSATATSATWRSTSR